MASIVASLTMALPEEQVPESFASLDDLSPFYKEGESLVTHSRSNWLQWTIHQTLLKLMLSTDEPAEILLDALDTPVGAWGPLYESDDGDEPAYLISFLCALRALLQIAAEQNLHVVHAWTAD